MGIVHTIDLDLDLASFFFIITFTFQLNSYEVYRQRSSGQAVFTGVVPSSPRHVPSIFIAGLAFPLLVDFHRMLLTRALALSATNHFFLQEKVPTGMCTR